LFVTELSFRAAAASRNALASLAHSVSGRHDRVALERDENIDCSINPAPSMCVTGELRDADADNADVARFATPTIPEVTTMVGVLGWIVFGLIVGALAKLLMPGRDPGGIIVTMALGIAGALLGGFVGRALGWYGPNEAAGFLMSLVGAVLLLAIYRMMVGRRTTI
jgi:uncharacterized membrane protein YeaQ/YmgE (transglycosylase-associated protein family)